jgi:hypothetical protein
MEPLMSLEGYYIIEDADRSRALLNKFYQEQGYTIANQQHDVQVVPAAQSDNKQSAKSGR